MPKSVYFIDGKFTEDPKIPVDDRGLYFSDGVYEVIRAKNKRPYFLEEHIERLKKGLLELKIKIPVYLSNIDEIIAESLKRLDEDDVSIYIQITRGKEQRSHLPLHQLEPTFILITSKFTPLSDSLLKNGVSLILYQDIRWGRCDIKTTMLLPNVMAKMEAKERGYFDALFYNNGVITESTSSSFFALKGKKLITHPADKSILHSITRYKVIKDIASELGLEVIERPLKIDEVSEVDGAFLAGTTYDILPVCKINDIDLNVVSTVLKIQDAYFGIIDKITGI